MDRKRCEVWQRISSMCFVVALCLMTAGCAYKSAGDAADLLNPFAEGVSGEELGERSNKAILGEDVRGGQSERARHALEVIGDYRRAQTPEPTYPVVEPAEVRLMWVPDHLNNAGDLVPAHYYYLLVRRDRWALQDAFDIEEGLHGGNQGAGAIPWVVKSGGR